MTLQEKIEKIVSNQNLISEYNQEVNKIRISLEDLPSHSVHEIGLIQQQLDGIKIIKTRKEDIDKLTNEIKRMYSSVSDDFNLLEISKVRLVIDSHKYIAQKTNDGAKVSMSIFKE